jgi:hypothetical protein
LDIKKASELFWTTFIGEYVEILCKYETSERMPLSVIGYLLDIDDIYYYIGAGPLQVESALKKEDVCFISIINNVDPTTQMLEDMPIPEDPLGEN